MAQRGKVQEYLKANEFEATYTLMTQGLMDQFAIDSRLRGDEDDEERAQVGAKLSQRLKSRLMEHAATLVGEMFTDAELDEIIAFHTSTVGVKYREIIPEFQRALLTALTDDFANIQDLILEIVMEIRGREIGDDGGYGRI